MSLSINLDLSKQKTSIPVLAENGSGKGGYRVRFANVKQTTVENKGDVLAFELHLLEPAPTTDGLQVKPGFVIWDRVYLYGKDTPPGEVPEMALTKLSKITDALLGTGDEGNKDGKPTRPAFNNDLIPTLIGKETLIKVKVKTGEYEGNEVSKYTYPGDLQP
jgi:hypothetical protein